MKSEYISRNYTSTSACLPKWRAPSSQRQFQEYFFGTVPQKSNYRLLIHYYHPFASIIIPLQFCLLLIVYFILWSLGLSSFQRCSSLLCSLTSYCLNMYTSTWNTELISPSRYLFSLPFEKGKMHVFAYWSTVDWPLHHLKMILL